MDDARRLDEQVQRLQLHYIRSHYQEQASEAAGQSLRSRSVKLALSCTVPVLWST